jgi:hypothetical protein
MATPARHPWDSHDRIAGDLRTIGKGLLAQGRGSELGWDLLTRIEARCNREPRYVAGLLFVHTLRLWGGGDGHPVRADRWRRVAVALLELLDFDANPNPE